MSRQRGMHKRESEGDCAYFWVGGACDESVYLFFCLGVVRLFLTTCAKTPRVQIAVWEPSKYLLLEITWDDYILYYILKYIPTYVRLYWPSTTTCQTHTKGPKYFYQIFLDITHTHTSNVLAFGGTGSTTRRVSFSVLIACKLHADPMIPQKTPKNTFPVKIFCPIFYFLTGMDLKWFCVCDYLLLLPTYPLSLRRN